MKLGAKLYPTCILLPAFSLMGYGQVKPKKCQMNEAKCK